MFNKDFYPTTDRLIEKMLDGVDLRKCEQILEPSAGKGNIAEYIKKKKESFSRWDDYAPDIDCIEIDHNLRHILKGNGFRVVHDDFLTFDTYKRYDLIIANVPFSEGDKHITKILEMLERSGGMARILCNAETIKNPYSIVRKVMCRKLQELGAEVEFIQDGFNQADSKRKTDVEVALIKVEVERVEKSSFIFENLKQEERIKKQDSPNYQNSLVEGDFIHQMIRRYEFEIKSGLRLIDEYEAMRPMFSKTLRGDSPVDILNLIIEDGSVYSNYTEKMRRDFIKLVRTKYWEGLFNNPEFTKLLTVKMLEDFRSKIENLTNYDFSKFNINEIKCQIGMSLTQGIEDSIMDFFDMFTSRHSMEEFSKNIHMYNGWKSNSCYKINKKIVTTISAWDWIGERVNLLKSDFFNRIKDIERVFDYLDSRKKSDFDGLREILQKADEEGKTKNIECKYFTINVYKKGTTHIIFKDQELLDILNRYAAQKKNWLPPSYGKKTYSEMTREEQTVVDEFEGKKEYNKVMEDKDYYLYKPESNMLLLR